MPADARRRTARRPYRSPTRKRQAEQTRRQVLEAARKLLLRGGYAETTVAAIAADADVSPKTVAAIFGSKTGILAAVLDPAEFGARFQDGIAKLRGEGDAHHRVELAASLTREIYEIMFSEFELLRTAGGVSADLRAHLAALEDRRRDNLARLVSFASGRRRTRSDREITDVLQVLTSYDTYRTLVRTRGWKPAAYETWLAEAMLTSIFESPVT